MSLKALKPISPETPVSAVAENTPATENVQYNTSTAPLPSEALLALIATMQKQLVESQAQAAAANAALANAILETTKPREHIKSAKEIAAEANEQLFKKNEKLLEERKKLGKQQEQNLCDHIAGCSPLSEQRDIAGRTSILWHCTDANVDIGICTVCQRFFHPLDKPDEQGHTYQYWRKKPSFNKISKAGPRQFQNPSLAMQESYLHDS